MGKYAVEFIGTFFLALTVGVSAVLGLGGPFAPLAIGTVLMVMIYAGGHISGAHYNPAVTVGVFLRGRCEAKDVGPYIVAQVLGGVVAAVLTTSVFAGASATPVTITAAKFHSMPAVLLSELLFTFALVYVVLNVATSKRTEGNSYFGLAIGFTVLVGAITVGSISLGGFNPAVSTSLIVEGKLAAADCWMHFVPQLVGGALAGFTFNGLNPDDR